jgi:hypothetical protein
MTDQGIARNMRTVAHAIGQHELAGLTVPPATTDDLRRVARGEMPMAAVIRNVYARFANVPAFEPCPASPPSGGRSEEHAYALWRVARLAT